MRRAAPNIAIAFFVLTGAAIVADPFVPGGTLKYAVCFLGLSNAALMWAYFGIAPPAPKRRTRPHGRRKVGRMEASINLTFPRPPEPVLHQGRGRR